MDTWELTCKSHGLSQALKVLGTMFEPEENLALIMKDGKIYKNMVK